MTNSEPATRRCQVQPCLGAPLKNGHCFEHLTPDEFDAVVLRLRAGAALDARNITIEGQRLVALLKGLRQDELLADFGGATFTADAYFGGATFSADVIFVGATFSANAYFGGATFTVDAHFGRATFGANADFGRATFGANADFGRATFGANADFGRATFGAKADFGGATFNADARFGSATFSAKADFGSATFSADARFGSATFSADAYFRSATFSADASFIGASFRASADFRRATFRREAVFVAASFAGDANFARVAFRGARELSLLLADGRLVLDDCVFSERVRIDAAARVVSAHAATFAAGVLLHVRRAEIALDDADFARPSTISGVVPRRGENHLQPARLADDRHLQPDPYPRLITLRGAQVAALSLSNVDLRPCRFFGAHGLESLSIESSCRRPLVPQRRGRVPRETIAEEHAWRGWIDPATRAPRWREGRDEGAPLQAAQIAALYRALRKAREDDKDEAGAGDLYYGEMEMRRHAKPPDGMGRRSRTSSSNAVLLWVYWLVSGYGLRPVRAFAALGVLLIAAAGVLAQYGFHDPHGHIHTRGYGRALLFALESTLSVLRPLDTKLSAGGELTQICLRLFGPLFFGLALLAIRARVKR